MKVILIHTPNSSHARIVEEFCENFKRRTEVEINLISTETREGASVASLYDIVRYPAIVITRDDGTLINQWQGDSLPLVSDVMAYLGA